MRISIQTLGTFGDVIPFITLARQLQERGHEVSMLAPPDYSESIAASGVTVAEPPRFSIVEWMQLSEERGTLDGPVQFFRDWRGRVRPLLLDLLETSLAAVRGHDLILAHPIAITGRIAAEHHRLPLVLMSLQPFITPSRYLPCTMLAKRDLAPILSRSTYLTCTALLACVNLALGKRRQQLVPKPRPRFTDLSRHLGQPLPRLTALPAVFDMLTPPDFDGASRVVDYPALTNPHVSLDASLKDFLADGAPPVHVGLGSMVSSEREVLQERILTGVEAAGGRALVSASLAARDVGRFGKHYVVGHVPHDQLFTHCRAVLHHGGAGTLDTASRAGLPQIVLPQILDQFWNLSQLNRLGLAPEMGKGLPSQEDLNRAFEFVFSEATQVRARRAAEKLRERTGGETLVELIEASGPAEVV